ncbi:MAG: hypothetical protein QOJ65_2680 [Fimbriimonadaceae bacterium]|jgi:hypothetical protein|nr:hypothetical protein [Fimbriimonadaceae bacterium]
MPREDAQDVSEPKPGRPVSRAVKLFVFLHLLAITSWAMPQPSSRLLSGEEKLEVDKSSVLAAARSIGRNLSDGTLLYNENYVKPSPLKFYLLFTGFWQYWDMFSPNPASIDFYGTATITYKDGTRKLYQYPRMYTMGTTEKYVSERYRKFYERAHLEDFKWIWPTFAQRVALLTYKDPANPPVKIVLTRHWLPIAPPGKPQQPEYSTYDYYTYTVDLESLKRERAGR